MNKYPAWFCHISTVQDTGRLRSALAKADTAEDAIRCCQGIFEDTAFQDLLRVHGRKDVGVVNNYLKNLITAAEKAERKLTGSEVDYIIWSCDHGVAPDTFLADVFLDRSTKPSGKTGGKPKGKYEEEKDDGLRGQNHAADVLADEGYDVMMLKRVYGGNGYGIKKDSNPDFLVEGRVFDAYTPKSNTRLRTIKNKIKDKTKSQTDHIVIVLKYYEGDVEKLKKYLLNQTKYSLEDLKELKAIVNKKVETWFVR